MTAAADPERPESGLPRVPLEKKLDDFPLRPPESACQFRNRSGNPARGARGFGVGREVAQRRLAPPGPPDAPRELDQRRPEPGRRDGPAGLPMTSDPDHDVLDEVVTILGRDAKRPAPSLKLRQHHFTRLGGKVQGAATVSRRIDALSWFAGTHS